MLQIKRYIQKSKDKPLDILLKTMVTKSKHKIYYIVREQVVRAKPMNMSTTVFINFESKMKFFFDICNKKHYRKQLERLGAVDEIIIQADKICNHIFDLLGSGDTYLGKNIRWNQDFKWGFEWKNKFYKRIKIIDLDNNSDVKVPWELSRFQHIPILGQAYWITNDEKYAKEFKKQIEDWIIKNPIEMSVNWTCAMDIAIRECNWIVGIYYFKESQSIGEVFWEKLNKSLYLHGKFIYNNLEKSLTNNNHYLADLVGLIWLGMYFRSFKDTRVLNSSDKWLNYGVKELELEIEKQVYEDGCDYEASTAYHCLVTELVLYTIILCNKNNIHISQSTLSKLEKMCEVIMNITKPNGLIPLIGDMDSGRFIIFTGYGNKEKRDFRYLLGAAGEYFDRDDFRYHSSNELAAIWLFNKIKEPKVGDYKLKSISYVDGGLHIIRTDKIYLLIRCGQNGTRGYGGHTHNDQLSFELNVDGKDFIVDPGTYLYTAGYNMRNLFRSTRYHNTLGIDDIEQNSFDERYIFSMKDETAAKVLEYNEHYFKGWHLGYHKKIGVIHERSFEVTNNGIIIKDKLNQDTSLNKYLRFHLSPSTKVCEGKNYLILTNDNFNIKLFSNNKYEILNSMFSKGYGEIEKSNMIQYQINDKESTLRIQII